MNKNFVSGTLANEDTEPKRANSNRGILNTFKPLRAASALHSVKDGDSEAATFQPYE